MFYKTGWKPLREITREIYELLENQHREDPSEWQKEGEAFLVHLLHSSTCDMVFWLMEDAEVGCITPTGVVLVSREVVASMSPYDWCNEHIDLRVGTVGTGNWSEENSSKALASEGDLRRRYGPFLFAPIVVREKDYSNFLKSNLGGRKEKGPMLARQIAQEIIKLFDEGKFNTRTEAGKLLKAKARSDRQFNLGWADARAARPEIGQPGRRRLR